ADRRHECQRLSWEGGFCANRGFLLVRSFARSWRNGCKHWRSPQYIPGAWLDLPGIKWRNPLASGLEFIHRRSNSSRAGLARSFADARTTLEHGMDRRWRLGDQNARDSPNGIAHSSMAR